MFDDTTLRARHILLATATGDGPAAEAAVNALRTYKKQVESQATEALKKVPADADALTRERARTQAVEEAFIAIAKEKSTCPSKDRGGDLGWFQRVGFMVEPFAAAAFALKPFEMSDVVKTPYGYHLILTLDRKPGREVQFEQVKERVRDVFADRLRESMVAQLRPKAKIAITPMK
jgi:parvulin-like peptidyl-prolyl isomerase